MKRMWTLLGADSVRTYAIKVGYILFYESHFIDPSADFGLPNATPWHIYITTPWSIFLMGSILNSHKLYGKIDATCMKVFLLTEDDMYSTKRTVNHMPAIR